MEFIKMFKRIVNNLKYTQNTVCFALGKIVHSPFKVLDKVFDNNLISKAASLSSLDQAFNDLYNNKIKKNKLDYVRYMDDFVFFAKTRNKLRSIVKKVHKIVANLRLWLAADKTYIGSIKKGFSFLGYNILGETLRISTTSLQRLRANINRLYEQQASNARLGRYLEKWLRWAKGGVNNLISPIKLNINPNPSTRMQVRVSNDMCHVFW